MSVCCQAAGLTSSSRERPPSCVRAIRVAQIRTSFPRARFKIVRRRCQLPLCADSRLFLLFSFFSFLFSLLCVCVFAANVRYVLRRYPRTGVPSPRYVAQPRSGARATAAVPRSFQPLGPLSGQARASQRLDGNSSSSRLLSKADRARRARAHAHMPKLQSPID